MDDFCRMLVEYLAIISAPHLNVAVITVLVLALVVAAAVALVRMPALEHPAFPPTARPRQRAAQPLITRVPLAAPRARAPSAAGHSRA